jgi:hypothetical protein
MHVARLKKPHLYFFSDVKQFAKIIRINAHNTCVAYNFLFISIRVCVRQFKIYKHVRVI